MRYIDRPLPGVLGAIEVEGKVYRLMLGLRGDGLWNLYWRTATQTLDESASGLMEIPEHGNLGLYLRDLLKVKIRVVSYSLVRRV